MPHRLQNSTPAIFRGQLPTGWYCAQARQLTPGGWLFVGLAISVLLIAEEVLFVLGVPLVVGAGAIELGTVGAGMITRLNVGMSDLSSLSLSLFLRFFRYWQWSVWHGGVFIITDDNDRLRHLHG